MVRDIQMSPRRQFGPKCHVSPSDSGKNAVRVPPKLSEERRLRSSRVPRTVLEVRGRQFFPESRGETWHLNIITQLSKFFQSTHGNCGIMGEPKFKMLQLLSVIHQPWHFDSRHFDCRHFDCRHFDCRHLDSTKIQNATVCE